MNQKKKNGKNFPTEKTEKTFPLKLNTQPLKMQDQVQTMEERHNPYRR